MHQFRMLPIRFRVTKKISFVLLSFFVAGGFAFVLHQTVFADFAAPCDTPPNCQPDAVGAGVTTLLELLKNNPLADTFGALTDPRVVEPPKKGTISIGGALEADGVTSKSGRVFFGLGTSTPGYNLDIVSQQRPLPLPAGDGDTAIARIGYSSGDKVFTGLQLDRKAGDQKWFLGMNATDNNLVIRANGNDDVVNIDPAKGAMCFGGTLRGVSVANYTADAGYVAANAKCSSTPGLEGSHVCTTEEIFRTQVCHPEKFVEDGISGTTPWINNGPSSNPDTPVDDCSAWTSNDGNAYGTYWEVDNNGGFSSVTTCNWETNPFACCK